MTTDIARWLARYELPFAFNPHFPAKTITSMRASLVVLEEDPARFGAFKQALFEAMWVDKVDLGDPSSLESVIAGAGFDAAHLLARCGEPEIKDRLKANTEEAASRGAFGAPTFFVGDEMFFGNDRLDFLEEALR
jgi:2-hydroxychromene-2-carboxylate isomerase